MFKEIVGFLFFTSKSTYNYTLMSLEYYN